MHKQIGMSALLLVFAASLNACSSNKPSCDDDRIMKMIPKLAVSQYLDLQHAVKMTPLSDPNDTRSFDDRKIENLKTKARYTVERSTVTMINTQTGSLICHAKLNFDYDGKRVRTGDLAYWVHPRDGKLVLEVFDHAHDLDTGIITYTGSLGKYVNVKGEGQ